MNISKIKRLILVKEIMDKKGFATVDQVVESFCAMSGENNNSKTKGIIRRDLESLCNDIHHIEKRYFTPDGEEILPEKESEYKNTRVQYRLLGKNSEVCGENNLRDFGGYIISPSKNFLEWKIQDLSSNYEKKHLSFSMRLNKGGYLSLSIKKNDLPLKLIIGRKNGSKVPVIQDIQASFGKRTSLLLLDEAGIERVFENTKFGHCVIEFGENAEKVKIRDLDSELGTYVSHFRRTTAYQKNFEPTNDLELNNILYQASREISEVKVPQIEPFSLNRKWKKVGDTPVNLETPCYIRVGKFSFYISLV